MEIDSDLHGEYRKLASQVIMLEDELERKDKELKFHKKVISVLSSYLLSDECCLTNSQLRKIRDDLEIVRKELNEELG